MYYHNDSLLKDDVDPKEMLKAIIVVTRKNNTFEIKTGNYILSDKAQKLRDRIQFLNQLSPNELRHLYRTILTNGMVSVKGGAGLGLIDIARKSRNKLEYDFFPINGTVSFFSLNIRIT